MPKKDDSRLSDQEIRVLSVLLAARPNTVHRTVLARYLWPEGHVQEELPALASVLNRLRKRVEYGSIETVYGGFLRVTDVLPNWAYVEASLEMVRVKALHRDGTLDPDAIRDSLVRTYHDGKTSAIRRANRNKKWPCLSSPEGCKCKCHAIAEGTRKRVSATGPWQKNSKRAWTKKQDEIIVRVWEETHWLPDVHRAYTEWFSYRRTMHAIRHRLVDKGYSMREGWKSITEVARLLSVSQQKITRDIVCDLLPARRHWQCHWWVIMDADLDKYIRQNAMSLDPTKIRDKSIRSVVELERAVRSRQVI